MGLKPATNPDVEAASIELTIDGKTVTAKDGVSLYDVISSTGKIIPAMCYHYTFDPFGSCGMCLVMQEGKKSPVRSCTAKAAAGMIVRTEGDDLFQARKKAVEKHLSVHPLDCPVCDADGHCELQDMAFQHQVTTLANAMMICLVKWNKDQRNEMYFFLEHNLVRRLFTTILSDLF